MDCFFFFSRLQLKSSISQNIKSFLGFPFPEIQENIRNLSILEPESSISGIIRNISQDEVFFNFATMGLKLLRYYLYTLHIQFFQLKTANTLGQIFNFWISFKIQVICSLWLCLRIFVNLLIYAIFFKVIWSIVFITAVDRFLGNVYGPRASREI